MKLILVKIFWLISIILTPTIGVHFRGGAISWYPSTNAPSVINSTRTIIIKQRYTWSKSAVASACTAASILNGTLIGETSISSIGCISSASRCKNIGYTQNVSTYLPCTDFNNILGMSYGQGSTAVNLTVQSYGVVLAYAVSGAWLKLQMSSGGWSLVTMMNLSPRNDNLLINSSPESVVPPIMYVPVAASQPTSLDIPMSDPDGDMIECRFSLSSNVLASVTADECADVCKPLALPSSTQLISGNNTCTLIVTLPTLGYYAVAIQIEDFLVNSTTPLSSVPVQFLLLAYDDSNPTSSCTTPPIISSIPPDLPTPGATVTVQVTVLYIAMVIARTGCDNDTDTSISNFVTSSPGGMLKTNLPFALSSPYYAINLTWTPTLSQLGQTFRFCAMAIDSNYLTSSQYCFYFYVGPKTTTTTTTTTTSTSSTSTTTTTSSTSTTSTSTTTTTTTSTTSTSTTSTTTTSATTTTTTTTTSLITTVTPYNYLPLVFGLALGLGLPLLCLLSLLPLLCLCRWCPNPFRSYLKNRFGRENPKKCPHCKKSISFDEPTDETENSRIGSPDSTMLGRSSAPLTLPHGIEHNYHPTSESLFSRSISPFDLSAPSVMSTRSLISPSKDSICLENICESSTAFPLSRPPSKTNCSFLVRAYSRQIQPL